MKTGARNQGAATAQITRRDRAGNVKVPAASRREGPRDCATKRGKKFPSSDNGCHVRPLGLRRKAVLTIIWEKKDIAAFATPQCRLRVGNDDVRSDKLRTLQVARRTKLGLSSLIERTPHCCMATRVSVCTISSTAVKGRIPTGETIAPLLDQRFRQRLGERALGQMQGERLAPALVAAFIARRERQWTGAPSIPNSPSGSIPSPRRRP